MASIKPHIESLLAVFQLGKAILDFGDKAVEVIKRSYRRFVGWREYRDVLRDVRAYYATRELTSTLTIRGLMAQLDNIQPQVNMQLDRAYAIGRQEALASLPRPPRALPLIPHQTRQAPERGRGQLAAPAPHRRTSSSSEGNSTDQRPARGRNQLTARSSQYDWLFDSDSDSDSDDDTTRHRARASSRRRAPTRQKSPLPARDRERHCARERPQRAGVPIPDPFAKSKSCARSDSDDEPEYDTDGDGNIQTCYV